jgi:hypothetical protein
MFRAVLMIALLLLPADVAAGQAQERSISESLVDGRGRVWGRVVRASDGGPLSKAHVTLVAESREVSSLAVRTARDGGFEFRDVVPGRYTVRASRTGYLQQPAPGPGGQSHVVVIDSGRPTARLEIRLLTAGVISGRTTDEDGEPVEGLRVEALRLRFEPGGRSRTAVVRTTVTDDLGGYRLSGLFPGQYHVRVVRQDSTAIGGPLSQSAYLSTFYPAATRDTAVRVEVKAGAETPSIDLTVRTGSTFNIQGHIVDGTPAAPDKRYTVGFVIDGSHLMQLLDQSLTFNLSGVEPGDYLLIATVSGQGITEARGYVPVSVAGSDVSTVLELGRATEVRGEVRMADNRAVLPPSVKVSLVPDASNLITVSAAVETGRFNLRDVGDGAYRFMLEGADGEHYLKEARCGATDYAERLYQVSGGHPAECTLLVASDVSAVNGLVVQGSTPVPDAVVLLIPAELERRRFAHRTFSARTNEKGSFSVNGVIPGDYLAFAVPHAEDGVYYDPEWPERNRERAVPLTIGPAASFTMALTLTPRQP